MFMPRKKRSAKNRYCFNCGLDEQSFRTLVMMFAMRGSVTVCAEALQKSRTTIHRYFRCFGNRILSEFVTIYGEERVKIAIAASYIGLKGTSSDYAQLTELGMKRPLFADRLAEILREDASAKKGIAFGTLPIYYARAALLVESEELNLRKVADWTVAQEVLLDKFRKKPLCFSEDLKPPISFDEVLHRAAITKLYDELGIPMPKGDIKMVWGDELVIV